MPDDRPTLDYAPPPKRLSAGEILQWSYWLACMSSLIAIGLVLAIPAAVMIWRGPSADRVMGLILLGAGLMMTVLAVLGFSAAWKAWFRRATSS
jgi:hypothetical protein